MKLNNIQQRRLFLEEIISKSQTELNQITRICNHTNIKKGNLIWSPPTTKSLSNLR